MNNCCGNCNHYRKSDEPINFCTVLETQMHSKCMCVYWEKEGEEDE